MVKVTLTIRDPWCGEDEIVLFAHTSEEAMTTANRLYGFGAAIMNGGWSWDNLEDHVKNVAVEEIL